MVYHVKNGFEKCLPNVNVFFCCIDHLCWWKDLFPVRRRCICINLGRSWNLGYSSRSLILGYSYISRYLEYSSVYNSVQLSSAQYTRNILVTTLFCVLFTLSFSYIIKTLEFKFSELTYFYVFRINLWINEIVVCRYYRTLVLNAGSPVRQINTRICSFLAGPRVH